MGVWLAGSGPAQVEVGLGTWGWTCSICLCVCLEFSMTEKSKVVKETSDPSSGICREMLCSWGLAFREDFLMGWVLEQRAGEGLVGDTPG